MVCSQFLQIEMRGELLTSGVASYESAPAGDYTVCLKGYSIYPYVVYELGVTVE